MKLEINKEYLGGERQITLTKESIAMEIANISAMESKDPSTQVGACIVSSDDKVISTGFNHNPEKWNSNNFPWRNDVDNIGIENTKYPYVIHAELDAITKCIANNYLKDATIYVTLFPCKECAKIIVSSGIKRVVYKEYRESKEADCSRLLLENSGVEVISYDELTSEKEYVKIRKIGSIK